MVAVHGHIDKLNIFVPCL